MITVSTRRTLPSSYILIQLNFARCLTLHPGSPFHRLGTPADIADVVAFVESDDARWLTGQTLQASGGIT